MSGYCLNIHDYSLVSKSGGSDLLLVLYFATSTSLIIGDKNGF